MVLFLSVVEERFGRIAGNYFRGELWHFKDDLSSKITLQYKGFLGTLASWTKCWGEDLNLHGLLRLLLRQVRIPIPPPQHSVNDCFGIVRHCGHNSKLAGASFGRDPASRPCNCTASLRPALKQKVPLKRDISVFSAPTRIRT